MIFLHRKKQKLEIPARGVEFLSDVLEVTQKGTSGVDMARFQLYHRDRPMETCPWFGINTYVGYILYT